MDLGYEIRRVWSERALRGELRPILKSSDLADRRWSSPTKGTVRGPLYLLGQLQTILAEDDRGPIYLLAQLLTTPILDDRFARSMLPSTPGHWHPRIHEACSQAVHGSIGSQHWFMTAGDISHPVPPEGWSYGSGGGVEADPMHRRRWQVVRQPLGKPSCNATECFNQERGCLSRTTQ